MQKKTAIIVILIVWAVSGIRLALGESEGPLFGYLLSGFVLLTGAVFILAVDAVRRR